jgi:hypothetical protein
MRDFRLPNQDTLSRVGTPPSIRPGVIGEKTPRFAHGFCQTLTQIGPASDDAIKRLAAVGAANDDLG